MQTDLLRGELERLFSRDEMTVLARYVLGAVPPSLGETVTAASFARSFVQRCCDDDALEALAEALVVLRADVDPAVSAIRFHEARELPKLALGTTWGDFEVEAFLGKGPVAHTYRARFEDRPVVLRVLRRDIFLPQGRVQAYFAYNRLLFALDHAGLPRAGQVGYGDDGEGGESGNKRRPWLCYERLEGETLAARLARTGPLHITEAWPIFQGVFEALAALHERRLVHGNLKTENVWLTRDPQQGRRVSLLDGGVDTLRKRGGNEATGPGLGPVLTARIAAPELHRGAGADVRSDLYAGGVLLYETLTGASPFSAPSEGERMALHLTASVEAPSSLAPSDWISDDLDRIVLALLEKNSGSRPRDVRTVLDRLAGLSRGASHHPPVRLKTSELATLVRGLLDAPHDDDAVEMLEAAMGQGADPPQLVDALAQAVADLPVDAGDQGNERLIASLLRIAYLFEQPLGDLVRSEKVRLRIVALDPENHRAMEGLYSVWRRLGKPDATLASLLGRLEKATAPTERGALFFRMGKIYEEQLDDRPQALNAYARALAADPASATYRADLERTAAGDSERWVEALAILAEAAAAETTGRDARIRLWLHLGTFSLERGRRPDLALPFFQRVLEIEKGSDAALVGLAATYQATQRWADLVLVLLRRAELLGRPDEGRRLRFAAATLLEEHNLDPAQAKDLYEQVFAADPDHTGAQDALQRIYERTGDERRLLPLLERRAASAEGAVRARLLGRVAELYESHRDDPEEAACCYEAALAASPNSLDTLRGQERILYRLGRYRERLVNLERQLELGTTPRQKVELLLRIAVIHDEEFLDQAAATATYEAVLIFDPDHETSLTALVRHYRALSRWEDLANVYERLIAASGDDSNHPDLWLARGRVLLDHVGDTPRALASFQAALALRPGHAGALEAVAKLRETRAPQFFLPRLIGQESVNQQEVTTEITAEVTTKVMTPDAKAEQWSRVARLLEVSGDHEGALEQYRLVLAAKPGYPGAVTALQSPTAAKVEGDEDSSIELLRKAIQHADNRLLKARLYGEMARLLRDRHRNDAEAEQAARHAFELDPTAFDARVVLGDLAFQQRHFREAIRFYEPLVIRLATLPPDDARRILCHQAQSLAETGDAASALRLLEPWLAVDAFVMGLAARLAFEHASPEKAHGLTRTLLDRFGDQLSDPERAVALYHLGESARRLGNLDEALEQLNATLDLAPDSPLALPALGKIYEHRRDWDGLVRIKKLHLTTATGELRGELLVELADIYAFHLGDRSRATSLLTVALEEKPNDRRWLGKLMQLYGEEKEWSKLVTTLSRLAELLEDEKQKAQYFHRAATISRRQLQDGAKALDYYHQALALDPSLPGARAEAIELAQEEKNDEELEWLLRGELERWSETQPSHDLLATFDVLSTLYERQGRVADTLDALEAAYVLDPDNHEREARLAALYHANVSVDMEKYFSKAVTAQRRFLERHPSEPANYRVLRKLYTDARQADAAWCFCQALAVLNAALPDEESFYRRMRSDTPAVTEQALSDEDWVALLNHPFADPLVTSVFALIEPAVIQVCSKPLAEFGHEEASALTLADHPFPVVQALAYASPILALALPPAFRNVSGGGLGFLHAQRPALLLGPDAFDPNVAPQTAMFLAVRHLTYYRPGFYIRRLLPPGAGLEAWLLAAFKLVVPHFQVVSSLGKIVEHHVAELDRFLSLPEREQLERIVPKLLESGGAMDLVRWMHAIDYTADRAAFLLAHDLQAVVDLVRTGNQGTSSLSSSAPPAPERCDELLIYATSEEYFELRQRLVIGVDS